MDHDHRVDASGTETANGKLQRRSQPVHFQPISDVVDFSGTTFSVTQAGVSPPTVISFTTNATFPAPTGTTLTWTAVATGGSGPLHFQFWRYSKQTNAWTMVRDYATGNMYSWTPPTSEKGTYSLQVWVRQAGQRSLTKHMPRRLNSSSVSRRRGS